jgi:hypothetical protein
MNEKYSFGDFTGQDLTKEPAEDFNDSTIIGSQFSQEVPFGDTLPLKGIKVFPSGVTGLVLQRCDVTNVDTTGITVESAQGVASLERKIMTDNEGLDCEVKDNLGTWEPDKTKRLPGNEVI